MGNVLSTDWPPKPILLSLILRFPAIDIQKRLCYVYGNVGKIENKAKKARVLLYDLETTALTTRTWRAWQSDAIKIVKDSEILCFAYKWLGEKKVTVVAQPDFRGYKGGVVDDTNVVKALHKLYGEADIIIAHNGNAFDQKRARARMMIRGLLPPSQYKEVDTLRASRQIGSFSSHKLAELCRVLDLDDKLSNGGHETWDGCEAGDPAAWRKMKNYNKHDVIILEQLYLRLLPWMSTHPSLAVLNSEAGACPKCGTTGKMTKHGFRITTTGKYQDYQCQNCGGRSHSRKSVVTEKVEYVSS